MNCLNCTTKDCKLNAKDCNQLRDTVKNIYQQDSNQQIYSNADQLVANGKAGQLSRLQEIIEFIQLQQYQKVGIAYCYGIEILAKELQEHLKNAGIRTQSYRCTINGIKECDIDPALKKSVNCNPIGQAESIKKDNVDFVIEMGLCLGHDVILHQNLNLPLTVFAVKDRVYHHNPLRALKNYTE